MKRLIIIVFFFPFISYSQVIKTYVIGTTIKESPYKLFTDAATIGAFKKGERIWVSEIDKEYFRSRDENGRTVYTLQSNLHNPDSLKSAFKKALYFIDSLQAETQRKTVEEKKEVESKMRIYVNKHGSNIDKFCFMRSEIKIGMSKYLFMYIKNEKPQSINTTKTALGVDEQYVYPEYKYYYFTNNKLTAIQD